MKRNWFFLATGLLLSMNFFLNAQEAQQAEFKPSGKATGKVFWNFNYNLSEDTEQRASFAIQRAYLGYGYNFSEKFSATILLDGAKKTISDVDFDDGNSTTSSEYTVFVKNAQLDYRVTDKILLSGGLIGLKQIDTQEKFWGYRYLFKQFQDQFALGTTADLGANAELSLLPNLKANLFVINGEGYTKLQDDLGLLKTGSNLIFEPVEGLILKGYYSIYGGKAEVNDSVINSDTTFIQSIDFFAGYKTEKFRVGAEYMMQFNGINYYTLAAEHDIQGIAINGAYTLNKKFELFGSWMNFMTNTLEGETDPWSYNKNGNIVLGGLQYTPVKGVKMALNYRTFLYDNPELNTESFIFMNFEFGF